MTHTHGRNREHSNSTVSTVSTVSTASFKPAYRLLLSAPIPVLLLVPVLVAVLLATAPLNTATAQNLGRVELAGSGSPKPEIPKPVEPLQIAQSSYKGDTAMLDWYENVVGAPGVVVSNITVDSNMTYARAIKGLPFSREYTYANISLLNVIYISFDGQVHQGQILVHRSIAREVYYFFMESYKFNFPIGKVVPLSVYGWDIAKASKAGATFGITISGDKSDRNGYSMHINPQQNRGGLIPRNGVEHDSIALGGISSGSEPFMLGMKQLGWRWGGDADGTSYARMWKPTS